MGCAYQPDPERIKQRLEAFKECIGPEATALFDAGNDSACATLIMKRLETDSSFQVSYAKMKASEAIDLFSLQETVSFFREYFSDRLKEDSTYR